MGLSPMLAVGVSMMNVSSILAEKDLGISPLGMTFEGWVYGRRKLGVGTDSMNVVFCSIGSYWAAIRRVEEKA